MTRIVIVILIYHRHKPIDLSLCPTIDVTLSFGQRVKGLTPKLTERDSHIGHQYNDDVRDQEMQDIGVEANQVVRDAGEDDGQDSENGQLGQSLAQEVHVHTIHAVVMLPQEHWHLAAEHLYMEIELWVTYFNTSTSQDISHLAIYLICPRSITFRY
jgi:hypothetical protein